MEQRKGELTGFGGSKRRRKSGPDRRVKRMRPCLLAKRVSAVSGKPSGTTAAATEEDNLIDNPETEPYLADYDHCLDESSEVPCPGDPLVHNMEMDPDAAYYDPDLDEPADILAPGPGDQLIHSVETALDPANYDPIPPTDWEIRYIGHLPADQSLGTIGRNITWSTKQHLSCTHPSKAGPVMAPLLSEEARLARTPVELWQLLFTDQMLDRIVEATNINIAANRAAKGWQDLEYLRKMPYLKHTDKMELKALIGLSYLLGLHGAMPSKLKQFFGGSEPVFGATMSYNRYRFLTSHLRLDHDAALTKETPKSDKFVVARHLFDLFNTACASVVNSGSELGMYDALLHISSVEYWRAVRKRSAKERSAKERSAKERSAKDSPAKDRLTKESTAKKTPANATPATRDGFLYKALIDPSHGYTYHTYVHHLDNLGIRTRRTSSNKEVVLGLLHNSQLHGVELQGRHITCDRNSLVFSKRGVRPALCRPAMSFELADQLAVEYGMTCTGLLVRNSKALPPPLLAPIRPVGDYIALFQPEPAAGAAAVSVHSWLRPEAKRGSCRHVVVATSRSPVIMGRTKDDGKQVPAIVKRYEAAIQGSTRLSQMRKEWLWTRFNRCSTTPLSYMLDVARLNARAVALLQQDGEEVPDVENFIEILGQELVTPHIIRRTKRVQQPVREKITTFLGPDGLPAPIYYFTGVDREASPHLSTTVAKHQRAAAGNHQQSASNSQENAAASNHNKSAPTKHKKAVASNLKKAASTNLQQDVVARINQWNVSDAANQLFVAANQELVATAEHQLAAVAANHHQAGSDAAIQQFVAANKQQEASPVAIYQLEAASAVAVDHHQEEAAAAAANYQQCEASVANHQQGSVTPAKHQQFGTVANHQLGSDTAAKKGAEAKCRTSKKKTTAKLARCGLCCKLAPDRTAVNKLSKVAYRCGVCLRHMCQKHLHHICVPCIPNSSICLALRNTVWLPDPLNSNPAIKQEVKCEEEEEELVLIKEEPKEEEEKVQVGNTDQQPPPKKKRKKTDKPQGRCHLCQAACADKRDVQRLAKTPNTCSACGLYTCRPHLRTACFNCDPTLLLLNEEEEGVVAKKRPTYSADEDPLSIRQSRAAVFMITGT